MFSSRSFVTYSSNGYLSNIYSMPATVLGIRIIVTNKTRLSS